MALSVTELRPGVTIAIEGKAYIVLKYDHVKMGRGGAIIRIKMKNLESGAVLERTFKNSERVEPAHVERRQMQFLYKSCDEYHFMYQETFDQLGLRDDVLGDAGQYLKDSMVIHVVLYNGRAIGVDMPASVELKVTDTGPGIRGDTVSGGQKPATLESGLVVNVPLFVDNGDMIKVDTRSAKYIERV